MHGKTQHKTDQETGYCPINGLIYFPEHFVLIIKCVYVCLPYQILINVVLFRTIYLVNELIDKSHKMLRTFDVSFIIIITKSITITLKNTL